MDTKAWRAPLCTALILILAGPGSVLADPITIDFNKCMPSIYATGPQPDAPRVTIPCCPRKLDPNETVVDGLPPRSTGFIRTRRAAQCTDKIYAAKLDRAYKLMRALPDDDPRSLTQQGALHCAYCGGAFYTTDANGVNSTGIDIHFGWLFYPWHRLFLYFHERILQSLLNDPTFSLTYWNWDNPYDVGNGFSYRYLGACVKSGQNFPTAYASTTSGAFDGNRSQSALGLGRLPFPDLSFSLAGQPLVNASANVVVQSNLNIIYQAMISGGTTAETFIGRPYRAGDLRGNPTSTGGGGSLEQSAHSGVHFWTGQPPPIGFDMGTLPLAARDPIFYPHHANVDRLFQVWKDIGPYLGQSAARQYYSDPDFLNAAFLFYDENKILRRVRVSDALTTEGLGYRYQAANDAAWILFNSSKCVTMNYTNMLNQANSMPVPVRQADGLYHLQAGVSMVMILDRPVAAPGTEQFLTINDINLNRLLNAGFDVYLNSPNPLGSNSVPTRCAEYLGRFTNMKLSQGVQDSSRLLSWSRSITETLSSIQAPAAPASVVVTIVPLSGVFGLQTITFSSVTISSTSS